MNIDKRTAAFILNDFEDAITAADRALSALQTVPHAQDKVRAAVKLLEEAQAELEKAPMTIQDALKATLSTADLTPKAKAFLARNPYPLGTNGGYVWFEHPTRGDEAPIYTITRSGCLVQTPFYDLGDPQELLDYAQEAENER